MPQPPFPPGEPATATREAAEMALPRAGDRLSPPRSSPRRLPPVWQEVAWVGFVEENPASAPDLRVAAAGSAAPPAVPVARMSDRMAEADPDRPPLRTDPADAWTDLPGSRTLPARPVGAAG